MATKKTKKKKIETTRVVIVGAGSVGATAAFAIMVQGVASEIVLIDVNQKKCQGEARDLEQGLSFVPQTKVWAGSYADCKTADIIIITAGIAQKPGQTRLELTNTNARIVREVVANIRRHTAETVILMVTNPLDVMTYIAQQTAKLPAGQIFGTGTTLDSSRFRYYLAQRVGIAPTSVGAYLLGEHGDSSVPVYSHVNVMGEPFSALTGLGKKVAADAYQTTRNAAYEVIAKKGATYYAIALAVARIVRSVLYDENHVFPVSVNLTGQYGIKNVCLSLPAVIGRRGVSKIYTPKLSTDELKRLKKSATIIRKTIDQTKK